MKKALCLAALFLSVLLVFPQKPAHRSDMLFDADGKSGLKRCEALQTAIDSLHEGQQYHTSKTYIKELENLSNTLSNSYFNATADFYSGWVALKENNSVLAMQLLESAKEKARHLPDDDNCKRLKIRIQLAICSVYLNSIMLPQAYEALLEGIETNKDLGDSKLQFDIENKLLSIYYYLENYREIIAVGKRLLTNPKYTSYNRFYLYYNIAACYTDLHCLDSAMMYLDTASMCAPTPYEKALVPYYKGGNNMEQHRYREALAGFDAALAEIGSRHYYDLESNTLIFKGLSYNYLHQYDSALMFVDQGLAIAEANGPLYVVERGLKFKRHILHETKAFEEYAHVSSYYEKIADSLEKMKNVGKLQQLELEHQFELREEQIAQAQLVKDMQQQRHRLILYLVIVALAFGIVTTVLLLNRNRILLKNKQIQEEAVSRELDLRNRELTAKALVQSQRQEIMDDIIEKLMAIQNDKKKMSDNLQSIINDFKQYRNAQTPEDFDYYFTQTHPDFYKNLSRDFPNLTPYETHLCAYIRLNLNTKEIAEICGIEPSSVRMARHRLRKSLGITDSDTDLTKFLSKY